MELLPDRLQVVGHLRERVAAVEEVAELLGAVRFRLEEVVELEAELGGELLHIDVAVVDEPASMLVDLGLREVAATAEAPSADPPGGFEDLRREAGLLQPVGGDEPGEPRADDDDPRPR